MIKIKKTEKSRINKTSKSKKVKNSRNSENARKEYRVGDNRQKWGEVLFIIQCVRYRTMCSLIYTCGIVRSVVGKGDELRMKDECYYLQ